MNYKDIRKKETEAHRASDARLGEKISEAQEKSGSWFSGMLDDLAKIGKEQQGPQIKMASAKKATGPRMTPQLPAVSGHHAPASIRSVERIAEDQKRTAESRTRSIENAVAKGKEIVADTASKITLSGADIMYLSSDISRWDEKTGEPLTGRLAYQIPFQSPHGDPRTIYANVDIVMGDILPPRYFEDGLNKKYAFDESGLNELLQGAQFEILTNPQVQPDTKYRGPDMFPPSGIPSSVAGSRGGMGIDKRGSSEITHKASGEKIMRVGDGFVRSIAKETMEAHAQNVSMPITDPKALEEARKKKEAQPSDAISAYPGGKEQGTPYVGEQHGGGGQTPAAITMSDAKPGLQKEAAGAWDSVVKMMKRQDIRMIDFNDLIQYLAKHGQQKDLSYEETAKKLSAEGIVLYRTAQTDRQAAIGVGVLIRLMAHDARREVQAINPNESGIGTDAPPDFEINKYLEPVEYKEYQAILDKWDSMWSDIQERERQNLEQGREAHSAIDYGEVQIISDQIKATQNIARERHDTEGMPAPSDVAIDDQTMPDEMDMEEPVGPGQEAPGQDIAPATLKPEKGRGEAAPAGIGASRIRGMVRSAGTAEKMDERASEIKGMLPDLAENGNAAPGDKGAGKGTHRGYPKAGGRMPELARRATTLEMTDPVKAKMVEMQLDPNNPLHQDQFMTSVKNVQAADNSACKNCDHPEVDHEINGGRAEGIDHCNAPLSDDEPDETCPCGKYESKKMNKEGSQSLDIPVVCKNCKFLSTPTGYSRLTEYKGSRLPVCVAPKSNSVGFEYAKFRECSAYDPIVKDIKQEIESKAPDSEQKSSTEKTAAASAPMDAPDSDANTLLDDVGAFMEMFSYEDSEPVHIGEGEAGEETREQQMVQKVESARASQNPEEVRATFAEISSFLEMFPGEQEQTLKSRIDKHLASENMESSDVDFDDSAMFDEENPELQMAGAKGTNKTAESLESAKPEAVHEKDSGTGESRDVREWCKSNGHYAPAGEHHPTHDWCTLWNTAVENLVMLPSGAVVPKSLAYSSSESEGEGGEHQFGRSQNQSG